MKDMEVLCPTCKKPLYVDFDRHVFLHGCLIGGENIHCDCFGAKVTAIALTPAAAKSKAEKKWMSMMLRAQAGRMGMRDERL